MEDGRSGRQRETQSQRCRSQEVQGCFEKECRQVSQHCPHPQHCWILPCLRLRRWQASSWISICGESDQSQERKTRWAWSEEARRTVRTLVARWSEVPQCFAIPRQCTVVSRPVQGCTVLLRSKGNHFWTGGFPEGTGGCSEGSNPRHNQLYSTKVRCIQAASYSCRSGNSSESS